ncbi:MAG: hypothetical protein OSA04_06805, partial [Flavobacteriales bacterium]|nr:hypothetical protein [Flavobacteriales bacterium]
MTKTYVMPLLFDDESRRRLIAEHRNSPVGSSSKNGRPAVEHSHELRTVLDKMRRHPMAGKYVSVCLRMFEEYKIGISSGVRGEPVKTFEEVYSSEEACEHAIFLKRISDLMEHY